jgi:hypothetical protein
MKRNNKKSHKTNNQQGINNLVHKRQKGTKRNIVTTSVLPMIVHKNIMSAYKQLTIKVESYIQSVVGSPSLTFALSGLSTASIPGILAASTPFADSVTDYQFFKITGVKMDVQRTLLEQVALTYASNTIPTIFTAFVPSLSATAVTAGSLTQSSYAFEVDPNVTTRQRVSFNFPPFFAYSNITNAAGSTHLYGMWNIFNSDYSNMPGEFAVSNTSSGNALILSNLYLCTFYIDVAFASDLFK